MVLKPQALFRNHHGEYSIDIFHQEIGNILFSYSIFKKSAVVTMYNTVMDCLKLFTSNFKLLYNKKKVLPCQTRDLQLNYGNKNQTAMTFFTKHFCYENIFFNIHST